MSVAPISAAGASLRVQIVGAAEAELIAAVGAAQEAAAPVVATAVGPRHQAVDVARAAAAGHQASLAPLFADLAQAFGSQTLPANLRAAIGRILSLQISSGGPLTAETIRQAVAQSGLFLEAHLAQPATAGGPDLKAALLVLQRMLAEAPARPNPGAPPPPPARDAALAAQPPVAATLSANADLAAVAQLLRRDVDQAISRHVLHQLASLPDGPSTSWMFELPVATPQGAAIAQFEVAKYEIDGDGEAREGAEADPAWQVRFAIDVEPLGPVHVHLSASRDRTAVTVWAEREASLERLRGQGEALARALPAEVTFHPGAPRRPVPPPGGFVDETL